MAIEYYIACSATNKAEGTSSIQISEKNCAVTFETNGLYQPDGQPNDSSYRKVWVA